MPPGQGSMRVHGTWKTVPIETRIALRYNGSAHRGVTRTASMPSAAAERKTAPTLVWSTMSSRTSDPPGVGDEVGHGRQLGPLHRGQCATVQVEPGELLDDVVLADEDGDAVRLGVARPGRRGRSATAAP